MCCCQQCWTFLISISLILTPSLSNVDQACPHGMLMPAILQVLISIKPSSNPAHPHCKPSSHNQKYEQISVFTFLYHILPLMSEHQHPSCQPTAGSSAETDCHGRLCSVMSHRMIVVSWTTKSFSGCRPGCWFLCFSTCIYMTLTLIGCTPPIKEALILPSRCCPTLITQVEPDTGGQLQ